MQFNNLTAVESKTAPFRKIKRQANGSVERLETDLAVLPTHYKLTTVTMPLSTWMKISEELPPALVQEQKITADNEAIRKALKTRGPCPECRGRGFSQPEDPDEWRSRSKCPRCNGEGAIPQTISGAKLLPRGEHLRIS